MFENDDVFLKVGRKYCFVFKDSRKVVAKLISLDETGIFNKKIIGYTVIRRFTEKDAQGKSIITNCKSYFKDEEISEIIHLHHYDDKEG